MLLDPFEKQFDLPATLVQRGDGQRGQRHIVGQEHQRLAGFRVFETDAPQLFRIAFRGVKTVQRDELVADYSRTSIYLHRVHPVSVHTPLGTGYEERAPLVEYEQSGEVEVAPIHHIECAGFDKQDIQHVDIAHLSVRDVDERWNVAAQVQQCMHLDRRFRRTKRCPWKKRQTQVDGRCIQSVDRVVEVDAEAVVAIQLARTTDKHHRQVFPDMPVASFVGVGQRRAFDWRAKAHPVKFFLVGQQTNFDVAQTLAVSQLGKGHCAKMFCAIQDSHAGIAAITLDNSCETGPRHKLHELREQRLAQVHSSPPEKLISGSYSNLNVRKLISNRHQNICSVTRVNTGLHAVDTQFNRTLVIKNMNTISPSDMESPQGDSPGGSSSARLNPLHQQNGAEFSEDIDVRPLSVEKLKEDKSIQFIFHPGDPEYLMALELAVLPMDEDDGDEMKDLSNRMAGNLAEQVAGPIGGELFHGLELLEELDGSITPAPVKGRKPPRIELIPPNMD